MTGLKSHFNQINLISLKLHWLKSQNVTSSYYIRKSSAKQNKTVKQERWCVNLKLNQNVVF